MSFRSIYLLLFLLLFLVTSCIPAQDNADVNPNLDCDTVLARSTQPANPNAQAVTVAAVAYRELCWWVAGPLLASRQMVDSPVKAIPVKYESTEAAFYETIDQEFRAGTVADLVQIPQDRLFEYAKAGYLQSLDECVQRHNNFAEIFPSLWQAVTDGGKVWGVPSELGAALLYFNKNKLRQLGWTKGEIDSLPRLIMSGQFTLSDLVETAKVAIRSNVVEDGFGFWPNMDQDDPWQMRNTYYAFGGQSFDAEGKHLLVERLPLLQAYRFQREMINSSIARREMIAPSTTLFFNTWAMEDAINHGRVLFWLGYNFNWASLTTEYRDDLEPSLSPQQMIGSAPYPSGIAGKPAITYWGMRSIYVIPSPAATGRQNQDAACQLLAQTITPKINLLSAARRGTLGVLRTQDSLPEFQQIPFQQQQFALWNDPTSQLFPGHLYHTTASVAYGAFVNALNSFLPQVQSGTLSPEDAVEQVVLRLRQGLGENVLIE